MRACVNCEGEGDDCFDPKQNPALKREIKAARKRDQVPDNYIQRIIQFARQGYKDIEVRDLRHRLGFRGLSHGRRPELEQLRARHRRVPESRRGRRRLATYRPHDRRCRQEAQARDLWEQIGYAAWACADPGIQFHTTINDWHTCPQRHRSARRTRARSTCSSTTRPATSPRSI